MKFSPIFEKKQSMPVIKNGIWHRQKKCSFVQNIVTGKGNIADTQIFDWKN